MVSGGVKKTQTVLHGWGGTTSRLGLHCALTRSASDASFAVQGCRAANVPLDESDWEVLFPDIYSLRLEQVLKFRRTLWQNFPVGSFCSLKLELNQTLNFFDASWARVAARCQRGMQEYTHWGFTLAYRWHLTGHGWHRKPSAALQCGLRAVSGCWFKYR